MVYHLKYPQEVRNLFNMPGVGSYTSPSSAIREDMLRELGLQDKKDITIDWFLDSARECSKSLDNEKMFEMCLIVALNDATWQRHDREPQFFDKALKFLDEVALDYLDLYETHRF